jgi:hypothetical protein
MPCFKDDDSKADRKIAELEQQLQEEKTANTGLGKKPGDLNAGAHWGKGGRDEDHLFRL